MTKRDEFLRIMDEVIPWDEWCAVVEPYYPSGKRGRPPRGVESMLRMYLLANWFNLSDEGVEDAIYDSYAFRQFMKVDFLSEEQVPDATTLCKFRKLLNDNGITKLLFDTIKQFLDRHGKLMHGGTIVDATIIEAPTSTKNASKQRDPEMHQVKKGNEWHFGARIHVGVDAGTGYIHSLEVNKANSSEVVTAPLLIRPDDEVVYGDAGYTGLHKRPEVTTNAHLRSIGYRINTKNPHRWKSLAPGFDWERHFEYQKSRIRSKVEYVFLIIKRMFHYRKVRYRGIAKNKSHAYILGACANLFMLAQSGWQQA
jgi:Transposase and inactivated derivatives, IS5 family